MPCSNDARRSEPLAPGSDIEIVPLAEEHLDQVVEIERVSFGTPWKRGHFEFEIRENRWALNLVLRRRDRVLGYACLWVLYEELKINNFAVHPDCRRRGLGRGFLARILEIARERDCSVARLEVRTSNAAALEMYEAFGFAEIGRRRNYYPAEGEDAIVMELRLTPRSP